MTILLERVSKRDEHIAEAKQVANDIVTNWDNPEYRQAFIWGLGELYGSILEHHYDDLKAMLNQAVRMHVGQSRRAIMKSYVRSTIKEEIAKDSLTAAQQYRQRQRQHGRYISYDSPYGRMHTLGMDHSFSDESARNAELAAHLHNAYSSKVAGANKQRVMFHIIDPQGNIRVTEPRVELPDLGEGEHLIGGTSAGYSNPHSVGEGMFNVGAALGLHPETAGAAAGVTENFRQLVGKHEWGDKLLYMGSALDHAHSAIPGHGLNVAAEMFKLTGQHGPDAARVLQPHMRRAMYRYRGIEAEPGQFKEAEKRGNESIDAFSRRLAVGLFKKLPTTQETRLMIESGQMPPSKGYLLNSKGEVVSVAIGHHDDHYLPFNLRKLGALKGGSYVRSRVYGGPTVEDLHVGLAAGARKQTIVSRSGVYEIQYSDRVFRNKKAPKSRIGYRELTGTYRQHGFGDPTRVMTRRYARLLDAINSGSVTDPDAKTTVVHPNDIPVEDLPQEWRYQQNGEWKIRDNYRNAANAERQRLANKRTQGSKTLQLDGHGYDVALRSLYQQYPFFFERPPKWTPSSKNSLGGPAGVAQEGFKDKGYIRPYHLKPAGVKADWHDERLRPADKQDRVRTFDEVTGYTWGAAKRFNDPDGPNGTGRGGTPAPSGGGGGGGPRGAAGRQVISPEVAYRVAETRANAASGQDRMVVGRDGTVTVVPAGAGIPESGVDQEILDKQVRARANEWVDQIQHMTRPKKNDAQARSQYNDLIRLRGYMDGSLREKADDESLPMDEREFASQELEKASDLIDELKKNPGKVEDFDTIVRMLSAKSGLPYQPFSPITAHGESDRDLRQAAEQAERDRETLSVPSMEAFQKTPEGMYHDQAILNHRWMILNRKNDAKQELSPPEQKQLKLLNKIWNRPTHPSSPFSDLYGDQKPNEFWNTIEEDADGQPSTEFHRYTNDVDEDGRTGFDRVHPHWQSAFKKSNGGLEPGTFAVRTATVFGTHGQAVGERHPKAPARAEDTALEADAKYAKAEEDIANGDLASREINLDELKDQADRGNTEAADAYATQARPDPEAMRVWDENDIENFLRDMNDRDLEY